MIDEEIFNLLDDSAITDVIVDPIQRLKFKARFAAFKKSKLAEQLPNAESEFPTAPPPAQSLIASTNDHIYSTDSAATFEEIVVVENIDPAVESPDSEYKT